MVRASRYWPNVYLGRPGALTSLPWPRGDVDMSYEKAVSDFVTSTGQHLMSSQPLGSRLITLSWKALHADNFSLLEQYWTGMAGVGPWAFINPSTSNMLLPNQASATSTLYDTTGWKTSTGATNEGTLFSNSTTTFLHQAIRPRSLQWQFTTSPITTPLLMVSPPYRNWFGIPAVTGLPYTWSTWLTPDGTVDSSITVKMRLRWLDATGATLSDSEDSATAVTTFTQRSVTATAPANTAYVSPMVVVTGSSVTTGASLYLDEPLLEQDNVINSWVPGTGVRPVEILSLSETTPFDAKWRKGVTMAIRELVQ